MKSIQKVFGSLRRDGDRKNRGLALMMAVCLSVPVISGCVSPSSDLPGLRQQEELGDVYLPPSFKLHKAHLYENVEAFRSWEGLYIGKMPIGEVEPLFVAKMPAEGWTLQDIRPTEGDGRDLVFHKGDEQALIKLSRKYDGTTGGVATWILATVGPRDLESYAGDARRADLRRANKSSEETPRDNRSIDKSEPDTAGVTTSAADDSAPRVATRPTGN